MPGFGNLADINSDPLRPPFTDVTGHKINMAKLMALSIPAYLAVPVLLFFAGDRAFDGNWPGVIGFMLDAAGCLLLARMITWASSNL
ncbi:MAG TPA: hypothetical protein VGL72_14530 [Bryobacteraceae bacterium]|jgi:hypothetical protein